MPTHFATPGHLLRTTGSMSASNESCSRCAKAVASMTPVPKCFPMKNTMPGTRRPGMRRDIDGNVDAKRETKKMTTMSCSRASAHESASGSSACHRAERYKGVFPVSWRNIKGVS